MACANHTAVTVLPRPARGACGLSNPPSMFFAVYSLHSSVGFTTCLLMHLLDMNIQKLSLTTELDVSILEIRVAPGPILDEPLGLSGSGSGHVGMIGCG